MRILISFETAKNCQQNVTNSTLVVRKMALGKDVESTLTLSQLGDLIHSQPGGGGGESAPLRKFAFLDPN